MSTFIFHHLGFTNITVEHHRIFPAILYMHIDMSFMIILQTMQGFMDIFCIKSFIIHYFSIYQKVAIGHFLNFHTLSWV